jgi:GNAT superfamily N-acetyltransferase
MVRRRLGYDRPMDEPVTIRPMRAEDADPAAEVMIGGGWGDRRRFLAFAVAHPRCVPFVAEVEGRIAGTGIATINGAVGWVGMIFVDEALRGRGVGTALTAVVIDALESAGCVSLALLASPLGQPIYGRLGFAAEMDYRLLVAPAGGGPIDGVPPGRDAETTRADRADHGASRLRAFEPADLAAILELDRTATAEDRAHILRAVVGPEATVVAVRDSGELVGYDSRVPWGTHPTVAPALVDGVRLLEARRRLAAVGSDVRTAIPEVNRAGLTALENLGWRAERGLTRMVRGAPIAWRPEQVWGQVNYAIG